jgi:hypothetical protein
VGERLVVVRLQLDHAQVRDRRLAQLVEVAQLHLAAAGVEIAQAVGARLAALDQADRLGVELHHRAPALVAVRQLLERVEEIAVVGIAGERLLVRAQRAVDLAGALAQAGDADQERAAIGRPLGQLGLGHEHAKELLRPVERSVQLLERVERGAVAGAALQRQLVGLRRLGQLVQALAADVAQAHEQRHLALLVLGRHDAELALERGGQLAPAPSGLEQSDQGALRLGVERVELERALVHAHRVFRTLELALVQLGQAAGQLRLLRLRRHDGDLLEPHVGQLGPGLRLAERAGQRGQVGRRLRRPGEHLRYCVPAGRAAGHLLESAQRLVAVRLERERVAVGGEDDVDVLAHLLSDLRDLEVDGDQPIRLGHRDALPAQHLEQLLVLLALAVEARARLERGRRARLELEHAVVGRQRGGVVAPLALLDAADLEEELGQTRLLAGHRHRAVAQLDRARPVPLLIAQAGQVVQHLHIVRPDLEGALQRGPGARAIGERTAVDVAQLAQEVEPVRLVDAEVDHLGHHHRQLGRALGAAHERGQADARAEVAGRPAGRALEQLLGAPVLAEHQLERAGGEQVHAGHLPAG